MPASLVLDLCNYYIYLYVPAPTVRMMDAKNSAHALSSTPDWEVV